MNRARRAVMVLPVLAMGLAACGSSGKPAATQPTGTPGAASTFVAAADRVCARQNSQEQALGPGLINADIVPARHLPRAASYLDKIVRIRTDGVSALAALAARAPADLRAPESAFVQAWQQVVADYRAAAIAAHQGNVASFRAAFDRVAPQGFPTGPDAEALQASAAHFSFSSCGKGSGL